MTIEDLAVITKRGFDHMATKDDIRYMATKDDIRHMATKDDVRRLEDIIKLTNERISGVEDDVHDIKVAMGPLVRVIAAMDAEMKNLNLRVGRLERKAGLTR